MDFIEFCNADLAKKSSVLLWKFFFFNSQQECIPVGCVPAARRPYAGGGGSAPGVGGRGVGVVSTAGVCVWSGGWCAWSGEGGCLLGGCLVWMGCLPQCLVRYHHHPPPCEQNDEQVQKYYLGHNFVAAGKNEFSYTVCNELVWL